MYLSQTLEQILYSFVCKQYESDFMKIIINQFLNDEVIIGAFYNYAAQCKWRFNKSAVIWSF